MSNEHEGKVHFIGDFEQSARNPVARASMELHIRERAASDSDFRKALTEDPRAVLKSMFGVDMPATTNVEVVQEDANRICLVIPAQVEEISDSELEAVAGGAAPKVVSTLALGEEEGAGWSPATGQLTSASVVVECTPPRDMSPRK